MTKQEGEALIEATALGRDTRWDDRKSTCAGQPALGADEPNARAFHYQRTRGEWVLFLRPFAGRLPDWWTFHVGSGEQRRFVELAETDVWDDLSGQRAAPRQERLHERWGRERPPAEGKA